MKKISIILAAAFAIAACTPESSDDSSSASELTIDFTMDKETAFVGESVKFTATVSGGVSPYTYEWSFDDDITSTEAEPEIVWQTVGVKVISLNIIDSKGNTAAKPKSKTFAVTAAPVEDSGDISIAWFVDFADDGGGVRGSVPAVDDEGNVYIATSAEDAGQLRKVAADGKTYTSVAINAAPKNTCMSPAIDAEGNIYVGGGSGSGGSVHKYSSALSDLWSAEFWNKGNAAKPKMWYGAPVVLEDAVLLSNAGSTGTMGAVSRADGSRISYLASPEGGGPNGGCRQSPVVSNDGYVWQVCAANGVVGTTLSKLQSSGPVVYDFFAKTVTNADGTAILADMTSGSDRPASAVVAVGGKNYCAGLSTPEGSNPRIYLLGKGDGNGTGNCTVEAKQFVIDETNTSVANGTSQDQGAIIVGANGEVITNLKAGAVEDGGLVAVDPETMTLAWEYRIAESVSCAPALTKEGNIAFGTDEGSFYIVKPNLMTKKAELIAKADIVDLIKEAGMTFSEGFENPNIKMWSGVCLGDDGKIYVGFQKVDESTRSGLLCLSSSAVTGPGQSCWPMFGVNRKHTGVQK